MMSSGFVTGGRSHSDSETSSMPDEGRKSTRNTGLRPESKTPPSCTQTDTEETPGPAVQPHDTPSFSDSGMHMHGNEETIMTSIRVTGVALGLSRVPAGFYAVVHHSGLEWRTENKPSSVNHDVVEWTESIPIPSALSATICLKVYASFEFQPMLGTGEQLRELAVTVEQLLDRSARDMPFTLSPEDGNVISPCSSILATVERGKCESGDSSSSRVLGSLSSSTDFQRELENATNQGHSALSRYRKHGEKRDLDRSVKEFKRALRICYSAQDYRWLAAVRSNLAMAKFVHSRAEDEDVLLSLSLYHNALGARPVGHIDRPFTLVQLAAVHFARFEKLRNEDERARAEALLQEAMELSSTDSFGNRVAAFMLQLHCRRVDPVQRDGQPLVEQDSLLDFTNEDKEFLGVELLDCFERFGDLADLQEAIRVLQELVESSPLRDDRYCATLGRLGTALSYRFNRLGQLSDLEDAISRQRHAIDLTPNEHPDKPDHLDNLGISFGIRFDRLGQLSDLEDAISTQRDAVDLTPNGQPGKQSRLNNLGVSFRMRFNCLGQFSDLEDAISTQRESVDLTPNGHPDKPRHLINLGISFRTRFECLGQLSDLEDAILRQRDAVDLTPNGHPDKPGYLVSLGVSLGTRFNRLGRLSNLEDAISRQRDAIDLTPNGHPDKPRYLDSLGNSLGTRFNRLGRLSDLEDAISMQSNAVDLTPNGQLGKPSRLQNLGISLGIRFSRLGRLSDLEDAISMQRDAVDLTPNGHPDKPRYLNNLGISLETHFNRLGQLSDLEDAISTRRDAVDLTPNGHPDKPSYLNDLGISFRMRFNHLGQLSDLEEAISRQRDAVDLTPNGQPSKPSRLNNLGISLGTRFNRFGQLSDLEDAILMQRDAVDLTPNDHPHKPRYLGTLGISFRMRFHRLGQLSDLEEAISMQRDAVDLIPNGHIEKPGYLDSFCTSLGIRFDRLGQLSDLEEAISRQRGAVDLTPNGHPAKPRYLSSLGNSFLARFSRLKQLSDLEDAISMQRDAVDLIPNGHPKRPNYLDSLGISFLARFDLLGQLSDLEAAISTRRDAVDLTPNGHPDKPSHLNNLGISFLTRFDHLGQLSDIEDAISTHRDAVDLTPNGHPRKSNRLNSLGLSFLTRGKHLRQLSDLEDAISLYSRAASDLFGPPEARFRASQTWILCARFTRHHSLLHAYSVAINLLPQLAWIGLSLSDRYSELAQAADVVREAAAAALESGFPETAVEWLEQGRSIVWGDLFKLRSSFEELSAAHPDHAHRLHELSVALDYVSATHEGSLSAFTEPTQSARESLREEADRHRALAIKRDELLQEIRGLPGFERFFLQKEFSQLRTSAHSGPVVILNAAESRCDALIVLNNVDHVIHVPLPNFTCKRSTDLQNILNGFLRNAREGRPEPLTGISWESLLSPLWKCVVKPVLDALAFSMPASGQLSHIFWCPTGPFMFLPIHAAGLYDTVSPQFGDKVFDFVISSYTPTLSILAPSPKPSSARSGNLRLLAVRQPLSDGQAPLAGVATELKLIAAIVRDSPSACTTLLESSVGTVEEVLGLMKEADWVHFACHGIQDATNPIDSGLCLAEKRRLKVSDIIGLSRPHDGLAFLSACETATGDKALSDEAIHIAAGMLFAGYGGVIGTMWSISDRLAPDVARDVYEELFRDGKRPDYRDAARGHQLCSTLWRVVP